MKSKPSYKELERRIQRLEKELTGYKNRKGPNRINEQYFQAILDNTNLPIYLKDAGYRYILVNRQYELLTLMTSEQIRGKDDFAIFPEPLAQLFRDHDEEVTRRRTPVEFEETVPLPDGERTFLTAKFPLLDSEGVVYAVGGVCTDITPLKRAQADMEEAEGKYRGIFEHSPLGIFHMNRRGIFTTANEKLAKILGSRIDRLVGFDSLSSLKDGDMRAAFVAVLSGRLSNFEGKYLSVTGKGSPFIRVVFSPIFSGEGTVTGAIGIIEDITRRKEAEEALLKAHDELEQRIADRTARLERKRERLMEANIALKVLLEKREEDKRELAEKVMLKIEKLILPYLEKTRLLCNDTSQLSLLEIIQANLTEITSSFGHNHKHILTKLTPAQIQIADLIKQGRTTKEIAALLNLSPSTIANHRQEIRNRLSLANRKVNLRASLTTNS